MGSFEHSTHLMKFDLVDLAASVILTWKQTLGEMVDLSPASSGVPCPPDFPVPHVIQTR